MKRGICISLLIVISFMLSFALVSAICTDADADDYTEDGAAGCPNPGFLDCNDNDPNVNPGMAEVPNNGLDDDCDGIVDNSACTDSDKDGYNINNNNVACAVDGKYDCDDSTATISPVRAEISGNGIDDNCDGQIDELGEQSAEELNAETPSCTLNLGLWYDCDGNEITTAHEGDSVFVVAEANRCAADSDVSFQVKELNEETSATTNIASFSAEYLLETSTTQSYWAGKWTALWEEDGTADPDPEYLFDATVSSSTVSSPEPGLKVTQCDTPGCGVTCDAPEGFSRIGDGGSGSSDLLVVACNPSWDCSTAEWSECDPDGSKRTRDTSLCEFTGHGDAACLTESQAELKSEENCIAGEGASDEDVRTPPQKAKCGNKKCESGETADSCPGDCKKPFPWILAALAFLFVALVGGGFAYYLLHKKKAVVATAVTGSEKSPFTNPNDLNSVMNYVKLSKQRNVPDEKILEMLRKSGWKDDQIKYAWMQLAKQQQPSTQASTQKPAQPGSTQQPEVKK